MSIPPTLEEGSVRRRPALLSALAAAALVAVALAGCAPAVRGAGNQPAGCTPSLPSGDASSIVTTTGAAGRQPKTTFPTPLISRAAQVTVLHAGHGTPAPVGGQVRIEYTVYNGKTGASLGGTGYNGSQTQLFAAGLPVATQSGGTQKTTITRALVCAQAGARIALTSTAAASFGSGALSQYGIPDSGTVVMVIDVLATYLGKADGVNQLPQDGMPDVITAVDGQPGIVIQELNKPATARSEVVKAGGGAVLKKGQKAVLTFTAWTWPATGSDKPTVVDAVDTWPARQAATVPLEPLGSNGYLPTKVVDALVGQKVGSQVLVVVPPKDGYPSSSEPTGVTATDTLVFVVDVLGVDA